MGEIQWLDRSGDRVIEDKMLASEYTVTRNDVTKTYRTSAYIQLTPSDDMEVTCAAINEAVPDPRVSIPLKLRYNYKPRLSLNVTDKRILQSRPSNGLSTRRKFLEMTTQISSLSAIYPKIWIRLLSNAKPITKLEPVKYLQFLMFSSIQRSFFIQNQ